MECIFLTLWTNNKAQFNINYLCKKKINTIAAQQHKSKCTFTYISIIYQLYINDTIIGNNLFAFVKASSQVSDKENTHFWPYNQTKIIMTCQRIIDHCRNAVCVLHTWFENMYNSHWTQFQNSEHVCSFKNTVSETSMLFFSKWWKIRYRFLEIGNDMIIKQKDVIPVWYKISYPRILPFVSSSDGAIQ